MSSAVGVAGELCFMFIQQKAKFCCASPGHSPGERRGKGEAADCIKLYIWVAPTSPGLWLHPDQTSSTGRPGQAREQGREHLSRCTALSAGCIRVTLNLMLKCTFYADFQAVSTTQIDIDIYVKI